jgi:hypothetical protein
MADNGWQRKFEDPIPLPKGRQLVTLKDAADYIMKLPKPESDLPEWQTAIEVLMLVARSGPTMMARIGVMKALNRHVERVFNPERKKCHEIPEQQSIRRAGSRATQINGRFFGAFAGSGFYRGQFSLLVKRDIDPASNDNDPMWLEKAA